MVGVVSTFVQDRLRPTAPGRRGVAPFHPTPTEHPGLGVVSSQPAPPGKRHIVNFHDNAQAPDWQPPAVHRTVAMSSAARVHYSALFAEDRTPTHCRRGSVAHLPVLGPNFGRPRRAASRVCDPRKPWAATAQRPGRLRGAVPFRPRLRPSRMRRFRRAALAERALRGRWR